MLQRRVNHLAATGGLVAPTRNSTLPSGPVIGLVVTPSTAQPIDAEPRHHLVADARMDGGIAHHAALADLARAPPRTAA